MSSSRVITTIWLCALAVVTVLVLMLASRAQAGYYVKCPAFTGPKWNQSPHFGTRYQLLTHGARCAFVTPWAKHLVARRSAGAGKRLVGGPPGYRCTTNNPRDFRASQGSCQKGATSFFSWAPKIS